MNHDSKEYYMSKIVILEEVLEESNKPISPVDKVAPILSEQEIEQDEVFSEILLKMQPEEKT